MARVSSYTTRQLRDSFRAPARGASTGNRIVLTPYFARVCPSCAFGLPQPSQQPSHYRAAVRSGGSNREMPGPHLFDDRPQSGLISQPSLLWGVIRTTAAELNNMVASSDRSVPSRVRRCERAGICNLKLVWRRGFTDTDRCSECIHRACIPYRCWMPLLGGSLRLARIALMLSLELPT